jgi:hypothetical protein
MRSKTKMRSEMRSENNLQISREASFASLSALIIFSFTHGLLTYLISHAKTPEKTND